MAPIVPSQKKKPDKNTRIDQALDLTARARVHLKRLCVNIPNRRVGSCGNQEATDYFAETAASFEPEIRLQSFDCMDWLTQGAQLGVGKNSFEVFSSPYSLGCAVSALIKVATSLAELEKTDAQKCLLLLRGEIAREQLMPTHFPFYNPPEHQRIFQLLSEMRPKAILCATDRYPDLVGGIYPFPLIEDGDFNIPSVFMTTEEGERLMTYSGESANLESKAKRIPSHGCNVIARFNPRAEKKVVLTAHIDTKDGTPGALDNAGGVVMLLLIAELLSDYRGRNSIELVAVNGEDYYAASGELAYLKENRDHLQNILLNINFDGIGYREGGSVFSIYDCKKDLASLIQSVLASDSEITGGEPWFQGDHMVFVQNKVPAVAFTSQQFLSLFSSITHTAKDRMELVDCDRLARVAKTVHRLLMKLDSYFS
jgi:aminopeptidase YwaD